MIVHHGKMGNIDDLKITVPHPALRNWTRLKEIQTETKGLHHKDKHAF